MEIAFDDIKVCILTVDTVIQMLRGIPVLKPYVNLHLHELDNLKDLNEYKIL